MKIRVSRPELLAYWRVVEYLALKLNMSLSAVHAEFVSAGVAPHRAKLEPAWEEPLPPGIPSRFARAVVEPRWVGPKKGRKESRRGKDSAAGGA